MTGLSLKAVPLLKRALFVTLPALIVVIINATYVATATPAQAAPAKTPNLLLGAGAATLAPTASTSVNVTVSNPNPTGLRISQLVVSITSVTASDGTPVACNPEEFTVHQFSGAYGFVLKPATTFSLAQLGFDATDWPKITMIDRPINQDGCKNATLHLIVTAEGETVKQSGTVPQ